MIKYRRRKLPENFILDLDGVLTDGKFIYTAEGKFMKTFGADDHDCLNLLKQILHIEVVTADSRGFDVSKKRVRDDMGLEINLVSATHRLEWISNRFDLEKTIYMGDGVFDYLVFREVFYSIAPANALEFIRKQANFVTENVGGERAVAEACLHILKKYFVDRERELFA
jgi:3-deoxy-D-manno-octulosonate 8-phosphate phosphatase (KDO 8-P phosphatase)